jgi:hypothetical protein
MDLNFSRPIAGPIVMMGAAVAIASRLASPAHALVIVPDFDTSITSAGDTAQVEGSIKAAIGTIESLYTNPGTVGIVFEQASGSFLGESEADDYTETYAAYKALLQADSAANPANTALATAIAYLPQGNDASGTNSIAATSALLRVGLGVAGATPCFNGSGTFVSGCHQTYDGVVTLSTSYSYFFSPAGYSPSLYNATAVLEHEIDEILGGGGQGSTLNAIQQGNTAYNNLYGPLDLYRYSAPGTPSFTTSGSATSYFSINGGTTDIVGFNQQSNGDYADFNPNGDVQSAFTNPGETPPYDTSSPEFPMMESIGYDGVTSTPEPGSIALLAPAIAGLRLARRRRAGVKAAASPTAPPS